MARSTGRRGCWLAGRWASCGGGVMRRTTAGGGGPSRFPFTPAVPTIRRRRTSMSAGVLSRWSVGSKHPMTVTAALFDVDGTLVDTNYLHAVAWWEAFAYSGHDVPMAAIHHVIGMGSDQLLDALLPG